MDSRDYPEAYQDLTDYGTKGHVLDKAANEIKKLRQQVAEQAELIEYLATAIEREDQEFANEALAAYEQWKEKK